VPLTEAVSEDSGSLRRVKISLINYFGKPLTFITHAKSVEPICSLFLHLCYSKSIL